MSLVKALFLEKGHDLGTGLISIRKFESDMIELPENAIYLLDSASSSACNKSAFIYNNKVYVIMKTYYDIDADTIILIAKLDTENNNDYKDPEEVIVIEPEITVNGVVYDNISDAIANAEEGQTIKGNGCTINDAVNLTKAVNIKNLIFKGNVTANITSDKSMEISNSEFIGSSLNIVSNSENNTISINNNKFSTDTFIRNPLILNTKGKVVVKGNVFNGGDKVYYNPVETGVNTEISGADISDNKFYGSFKNNAINIFAVKDNISININNNYFENPSNCVRLSNVTNHNAIFYFKKNQYCNEVLEGDAAKYMGFLLCQSFTETPQDFSKYNLVFSAHMYKNTVITRQIDESVPQRTYYTYDNNTGGSTETNPKVTFIK